MPKNVTFLSKYFRRIGRNTEKAQDISATKKCTNIFLSKVREVLWLSGMVSLKVLHIISNWGKSMEIILKQSNIMIISTIVDGKKYKNIIKIVKLIV